MGVHSISGGFLEGLRHHPKFLPSSRCALLKEIVAVFVNFELPKSDEKEKVAYFGAYFASGLLVLTVTPSLC